MKNSRAVATINSALWAAYGDVLGFPTELTDGAGLKRRVGEYFVDRPLPWKRLVGGRSGAWVKLDAGTYSDDTQLRLATSRSIRADGYFDVEAFAKIELPVWLSYSLGAGRGSKVGAASLSQRSVNWFSNFFDQRDIVYVNGGGNGAAMRIQPHVWAAKDLRRSDSFLEQVVQNSICTHGHPRGIAGAAIHAALLAYVLNSGELPAPKTWRDFGSHASIATSFIENNPDLSTFWLPTWNTRSNKVFAEEMELARMEWESDVNICISMLDTEPSSGYRSIVEKLDGLSTQQRGSGLKCTLFSLVAAWLYKDIGANEAIITIANFLSSDTDTIGTMAGALLGALPGTGSPPYAIQDDQYIRDEASRLFSVSQNTGVDSFAYPDLMTWQPPRNQLDVVGLHNDSICVSGLGQIAYTGENFLSHSEDISWQWLQMPFGQSILCKQRNTLKELSTNNLPAPTPSFDFHKAKSQIVPRPQLGNKIKAERISDLFDEKKMTGHGGRSSSFSGVPAEIINERTNTSKNLNDLTDEIIKSGFNPTAIGITLMAMAEDSDGIERAIAFAAVIIKARQARLRRNKD